MATLKDLIRAETLKVGSRGAMPSNQIIALVEKTNFTSPNGESVRYVAPCDGVLSAFLQAAGRDGNATPGVNIADGDGRRHAARTTDGSVHMNLRKGNSATVSFYEAREHIEQWIVRFTKTIGGGYKQYLSSLSRSRFGGAPWLRLKTASETLRKLEAGSRSRLNVASSSRVSRPQLSKEFASTCRPKTAYAPFGLRVPKSMPRFAKTEVYKPSRQAVAQHGQKPAFLAPVGKGSPMRYGVRSSEVSSTSFLLSVASNNARMEVAA